MRKFSQFFFFICIISGFAQSVNLYNPADNSVYPSQLYFCGAETFNLKVDAVATSTGDYAITKGLATNFGLSAGSIPITFPGPGADKFSDAFPIGFDFSFYGKTYKKVVAGSNGRLVFTNDPELENLKNTTTFTDRTFSGITGYNTYSKLPSKDYNKIYRSIPTQELNLSQIFFGYTDLVPKSKNGSVTYLYKNVVLAGVNGLMVSFQKQIRTNGLGGDSSTSYDSYILLLEDGRIIISVYNKSEVSYNAILGIQNDDASKFKVPNHSNAAYDYNNGPWNSEGTAFIFTPNQNLTPKFKWYQNATVLAETSNTLSNFAPNDNDVLKVEVAYFDSSNIQVGSTVSDQITFKKIAIPVINSSSSGGCVTGVTLSVPNDPDLNFEWFRSGNATGLGTGNTYFASQTGNYFVKVSRKTLPSCSENSAPVAVNLSSTIPAFNASNQPLNFCDTTGATTKTINLYDYYPQSSSYSLVFTEGTTVVPNPANFVISGNTTRTINIKVNDPVSGCSIDMNFTLRFDALPTAINNLPKKYCFGGTSVDVSQYLQDLAGTNFAIFDYQYSTDGINYSSNSIINPKTFPKVWVKILPKNLATSTCATISTIVFTEDAKVLANAPTTQLAPQCASATQTFNLASLIPEVNPDPNVTVTFHQSLNEAQSGANAVANNFRSGLGSTILYIRVVNNVTNCVSPDHPSITLLVYLKPNLLINNISQSNCAGNSIFNLTQNSANLTNATAPVTVTLEYYSTNGTLLTGTQIINYNEATYGPNPYIKVIYNTTCSDTIPFNLTYNPLPTAIVSQILICSQTTYSLQDFQNSVINNSTNYTFTDDLGNALPANFDVSVLPKTIKFLIKDKTTGCLSNVQSITFVKGGNSVLLNTSANIEKCDTDFDGKTDFKLDDVKTTFTTDPTATFEYFKDATFLQSITANYTNETPFAQTVYVRITLPNFCPSTAEIYLKVNTPTKSSTLLDKYFICFGETLSIDAGTENTIFDWSDGQNMQIASFTQAGNYSVILKNGINGCPYTHNFTISDENQPKIEVINQTNTSIEVIANGGAKPYRYYFNGIPQSSNILMNPTEQSYEIQVESATGCFGPPKTVYFIKINNAFTPNADGINDFWSIANLDKMEQVSIVIVDRNGAKVFESTNPNKTEWDGRNFGRALPTSAYWYTVSWYDSVTQKNEQRQGWILLKNRN